MFLLSSTRSQMPCVLFDWPSLQDQAHLMHIMQTLHNYVQTYLIAGNVGRRKH